MDAVPVCILGIVQTNGDYAIRATVMLTGLIIFWYVKSKIRCISPTPAIINGFSVMIGDRRLIKIVNMTDELPKKILW